VGRMNKKAVDYSIILLLTVMISIPVLYWRMTTTLDATAQDLQQNLEPILKTPYDKDEIIVYVKTAAEIETENILAEIERSTKAQPCERNTHEAITEIFNTKLNPYIKEYNAKTQTQIPTDNYDLYIEPQKINAIATIPVEKKIQTTGTIWFAPSFTITADTQRILNSIQTKRQRCESNT
jgi:hypothetical protein